MENRSQPNKHQKFVSELRIKNSALKRKKESLSNSGGRGILCDLMTDIDEVFGSPDDNDDDD